MPDFTYTARSLAGESVTGTLVGANKREVLAVLADRALFPIRVEEKRRARRRIRRRIKAQDLATNLNQLADLLRNGVPLLGSLTILAEQCTHPELAEVLVDVRDQVSEGTPLDQAFARHVSVFGELTVSMVRAGSEGAFLEDALGRTAKFLENQEELKARVTGAMIYPVFLLLLGTTVTVVLIVFFVPMFAKLFQQLEQQGGGLPMPTVLLLGMSDFLKGYGLFLLIGLLGLVVWLRRWAASEKARLVLDRWKLRLPVIGPIFHGYAVSRFCRILGTLTHNGVPLLKALDISSGSAGNRVLAAAIRRSAENISAGETLAGPLAQCGLIPKPVMAMIRVAEEANNLDEVLVGAADAMDRNTARKLDVMVRLVEPAMLLMMGGIMTFVLSALLLPVFDMMSLAG